MQNEARTTFEKLEVAKRAPTATFDHLKHQCSNMQLAEAAGQGCMKSNLCNYTTMVFDQEKQNTEPYQLNFEGYIPSLGTALA